MDRTCFVLNSLVHLRISTAYIHFQIFTHRISMSSKCGDYLTSLLGLLFRHFVGNHGTHTLRLICGQYYNNKINMFIIQYLNKITVHNGPGLFKYFHSLRIRSMPYLVRWATVYRASHRHRIDRKSGKSEMHLSFCLFCLIASAKQLNVTLTEVSNNDDDDDNDTNWYAPCKQNLASFNRKYRTGAFSMQISIKFKHICK